MTLGNILGAHQGSFLSEYWQKKPLLIRSAFPGGLQAVDADELAGLACSEGEGIEARLVLEKGKRPWETRHGPFAPSEFSKLPSTHWTLLVQAVDRLLPEVSALRQHFRFLPNWRIDDVMISYAPDQGSVGPHTDHYDVFLIQGRGRRRWEFESTVREKPDFIPDLDMKILARFEPDQSWILEEGDMLYLPPGIPHHGVALGESITYSMGFRAPHRREMLASFCQFLLEESADAEEVFYGDSKLLARSEPGAILPEEVERLWQLLASNWDARELFKRWVGSFVTEPRSFHESIEKELKPTALLRELKRRPELRRAEGGRFAYLHDEPEAKIYFYVEGQTLELTSPALELVAYLCREEIYKASYFLSQSEVGGALELLTYLWNQGLLRSLD